jgi:glycosyltransferase involved in cell wall biosynthesis
LVWEPRLRIAHILGNLDMGGAETVALRLIERQSQHGHICSVHTLFGGGTLEARFRDTGIELRLHHEASKHARVRVLRTDFRELGVDVVHCHNIAATLLGALAARLNGVRSVISTWHSGSFINDPGQDWKYALAGRMCSRMVTVCSAARRALAGVRFADASRIVTIYNGTDPLLLDGVTSAEPRGEFTVVQVGRMAPPKDPLLLLDAFRLVLNQAPGAMLWIVGDGVLLETARNRADALSIADAVVLWGRQRDVRPYLAGAEIFTLCSNSEGVPMALLEAMSAGLPAVVSDAGGMREVVEPGASALVPVGDAPALAAALLRFGLDPELRRAAAPLARARFERDFTLERMARAYEQLYAAALD